MGPWSKSQREAFDRLALKIDQDKIKEIAELSKKDQE